MFVVIFASRAEQSISSQAPCNREAEEDGGARLGDGYDAMGRMEEMHYALGSDGQYQPVMPQPHELGHNQPFLQGQTGGQTFASTLLLSFSCSPLLKQHLLRSLHMTNEELASLEPVLSNAWD